MDAEQRQTLDYIAKNISYVAPYDGDKYSLSGFIGRIESLIPLIDPLSNELKVIVLGFITDKIIGKAKESLIRNGTINTWTELKNTLIKCHGERTPVNDLIDELKLCRCDSTVEAFYHKINALLCRINNSTILNGEGELEQIASNRRLALKHFTEGLPPLAKNLIGCQNPESLEDAYDLLTKFGYLSSTHNKNNVTQSRSSNFQNNSRNNQHNNYTHNRHPRHNYYDRNVQRNEYRQEPRITPRNYTNSGQSRNFNNNYRSFRQHPQRNFNGRANDVEPMDIGINENRRDNSRNYQRNDEPQNNSNSVNINSNENSNFHVVTENNYPI